MEIPKIEQYNNSLIEYLMSEERWGKGGVKAWPSLSLAAVSLLHTRPGNAIDPEQQGDLQGQAKAFLEMEFNVV